MIEQHLDKAAVKDVADPASAGASWQLPEELFANNSKPTKRPDGTEQLPSVSIATAAVAAAVEMGLKPPVEAQATWPSQETRPAEIARPDGSRIAEIVRRPEFSQEFQQLTTLEKRYFLNVYDALNTNDVNQLERAVGALFSSGPQSVERVAQALDKIVGNSGLIIKANTSTNELGLVSHELILNLSLGNSEAAPQISLVFDSATTANGQATAHAMFHSIQRQGSFSEPIPALIATSVLQRAIDAQSTSSGAIPK